MNSVKGTLNSVQLIGRLGRDPELRFTTGGTGVCEFSVATNRIAGRNANGEREYATEWINVQVWEKLADVCNTYLRKGRRVMVSGSLRTDSWEDRDTGQRRYKTYVRATRSCFSIRLMTVMNHELSVSPMSRSTTAVTQRYRRSKKIRISHFSTLTRFILTTGIPKASEHHVSNVALCSPCLRGRSWTERCVAAGYVPHTIRPQYAYCNPTRTELTR